MEKKIYKIPVVWSMMGYLSITASNEQEAIALAEKEVRTCSLPKNGEYLDDSFEIDQDVLKDLGDDRCLMSEEIHYENGSAFLNDLLANYGIEEGFAKARRYLEIPLPRNPDDRKEEQLFRRELIAALEAEFVVDLSDIVRYKIDGTIDWDWFLQERGVLGK